MHWIDLSDRDIAGRLAIAARPRQPSDVFGLDQVVSMLTDEEITELDLHWLSALRVPIPDRGLPPNRPLLHQLAQHLAQRIGSGQSVLIHCRAGIGRSALLAGAVMAQLGWTSSEEIFQRIAQSRGVAVPDTPEQALWLAEYLLSFQGQPPSTRPSVAPFPNPEP